MADSSFDVEETTQSSPMDQEWHMLIHNLNLSENTPKDPLAVVRSNATHSPQISGQEPPTAVDYIDGLPVEVLFHIFLLLVQNEFDPDIYDTFIPWYPWELTIISRRWRQICLDSPALWSYFDLSECDWEPATPHPEAVKPSLLTSRTCLQLERSHGTPLFIDATLLCDCPSQLARFRAVIGHSYRWREVYFPRLENGEGLRTEGNDSESMCYLASLHNLIPSDNQFPILRRISWHPIAGGDGSDTPVSLKFAPSQCDTLVNLRSVTFHDVTVFDNKDDKFPWNRITDLTLLRYHGTFSSILSLLPALQNLEELDIGFHERQMEEEDDSANFKHSNIVLPNLKHLHVSSGQSWEMKVGERLLPFFITPALRYLSYQSINDDSIVDFVARSSCSLLELSMFQPYNPIILSMLRTQPELQVLRIGPLKDVQSPRACDDLLQSLVRRGSERQSSTAQYLCPSLSRLYLNEQDFKRMSLIDFIKSRMHDEGPPQLKLVRIGYSTVEQADLGREYYSNDRKYDFLHQTRGFVLIFGLANKTRKSTYSM